MKKQQYKKLWIMLLLVVMTFPVYSQQQLFAQYMFDGLTLNPAYASISEGISVGMLWREQWVGFDGAPSTQTVSIHSPVKYQPITLGVKFISDKIGVTERYVADFSYAYYIKFANSTKLSLGLQVGLSNYRIQFQDDGISAYDPTLANGNINEINMNVGAGIMYYSDEFYVGLCVPQLLKESINSDSKITRHYFIMAGKLFDFGKEIKLKPSLLIEGIKNSLVIGMNCNVLFMDLVWVGVSYRVMNSINTLVQLQLTQQLQLGYSYEFAMMTDFRRVNSGSHGIMLSYIFTLPTTKILTPRYF